MILLFCLLCIYVLKSCRNSFSHRGSMFFFLLFKRIAKERFLCSGVMLLSSADVLFLSWMAMMNVFPVRLMYISVMNGHKRHPDILTQKCVHQLFVQEI